MDESAKSFVVHIGLPRAASTFLQTRVFDSFEPSKVGFQNPQLKRSLKQYMRQNHPDRVDDKRDLFLPIPDGFRHDMSKLVNAFSQETMIISWEGLCGRWDRNYTDFEQSIELVKTLFPDPQIIFVVREQISWLASLYKYMLGKGLAYTQSEFLRYRNGQFETRSEFDHLGSVNALEFDWIRMCGKLFNVFGKRNVHIIFYEDFLWDFEGVLKKISDVVGENFTNPITFSKANSSRSALSVSLISLHNLLFARGRKYSPHGNLDQFFKRSLDRIAYIDWNILGRKKTSMLREHYAVRNLGIEAFTSDPRIIEIYTYK